MRPHLLDFPYGIVDLGRIDDAERSGSALLRFGLRLLKHVFLETDPRALVDEAAVAVLRADPDFFVAALRYIIRTYRGAERPDEEAETMSTWAEELLRGGEARGMAKGKAEGKAETLLRQMRRRFGTVPEAAAVAVQSATAEQLDQWLDNFVDAPTVDAVFGKIRPN